MTDKNVERRKFSRIRANWLLYYRVAGEKEFHRGSTENISEGGIRFRSPVLFSEDEMLEVALWLPLFSGMINFKTRVIWSRPNEVPERYDTGMAIVEIAEENKNKLRKQIETIRPLKAGI